MKQVSTILKEHVGQTIITGITNERIDVFSAIGPIQKIDIGKRVYRTDGGIIQVESSQQRDTRLD